MAVRMMPMPRIVMIVTVQGRPGQAVFAAEFLVAAGGIAIAVARAILKPAANALDMVVMACLRQSDFVFEAKHLLAVLAHLAVHHCLAVDNLLKPLLEG
ncbi:MAG: hypothetical protein KDJ66_12255, partial [Nitratireductor sp.]|nr:hypothetical protein [Nitratireductor sp.]